MTAIAESRGLRAFAIIVLGTATIVMLALSMLTNATFGYRFGSTTLTAAVFAAANVIADVWKGLGLIVVGGLVRERHRTIAAHLVDHVSSDCRGFRARAAPLEERHFGKRSRAHKPLTDDLRREMQRLAR